MSNWLKDFGKSVSNNLKESIMSWPTDMGFTSLNPNQALGNMIGAVTGQNRAFDAQMELNKLQMQREDTAYQRMAEDMKLAGLNPAGAISTGGSSAGSMSAPSVDGSSMIGNALGLFEALQSSKLRSKELDIQRDLADAEIANKKADTDYKNANNQYMEEYRPVELATARANLDNLIVNKELTNAKIEELHEHTNVLAKEASKLDAESSLIAQQALLTSQRIESERDANIRENELHSLAVRLDTANAKKAEAEADAIKEQIATQLALDKETVRKMRAEEIIDGLSYFSKAIAFSIAGAKAGAFAGPHGMVIGAICGATVGLSNPNLNFRFGGR